MPALRKFNTLDRKVGAVMKFLGMNIRRKIGGKERKLSLELGLGDRIEDALVERQLTSNTYVNLLKAIICSDHIIFVGRITNWEGRGTFDSYKLSPFFTQVVWADGRRGTTSHEDWNAALASALTRVTGENIRFEDCYTSEQYSRYVTKAVARNLNLSGLQPTAALEDAVS